MSSLVEAGSSTPMSGPRRVLFILFALGSLATVIAVSVLTQRGWAELTERARTEMARFPIVSETVGEIVEIRIDRERRASISNQNQVAMDLHGTIDIGTVQVEIVEGAHGVELIVGDTLTVGDRTYPLVEGDPPR